MRRAALAFMAVVLAAAAPHDPPGVVHMSQEQQKTIKLQTARAEQRPITEPVRVPGTVAFEGHVARLRPLAQGRVLRLLVQPGDQVAAGQPLAELDTPMLTNDEENLSAARRCARRRRGSPSRGTRCGGARCRSPRSRT